MLEGVKNGKINAIIVKDLSRFMRDYISLGDYLENIFPFLGIRFIAINDGYDSDKEKGMEQTLIFSLKVCYMTLYKRYFAEK